MLIIGVIASVVLTAGALIIDWFPDHGAAAAGDIDTVYDVLLIVSMPIFVLVMTVAIYSVVKFRARPGQTDDGVPIHGHTKLEIVWVTIPFILVSGLAIYAWIVLDDIEAKKPNELVVDVTGRQFTWNFMYPYEGKVRSTELVLPKDRPVKFNIRTKDVIHSFWVPQFRLKSDAVPGLTTKIRLTPDRVGKYEVVCAELCGLGHATMRQAVSVVPARQFDAWIGRRKRAAGGGGGGGGGQKADGKQVFSSAGCGSCHTFAAAGSTAKVGPNLDQLAKAAGSRRPGESAEAYVKESILKPGAFTVKGFPKGVMPSNFGEQLSGGEVDALVEYLLGGGKGK